MWTRCLPGRSWVLSLLGIVALATALRVAFFVGYANVDPWDDTLYLRLSRQARSGNVGEALEAARQALDGGLPTTGLAFVVRRGTYLPIAACQRLFGENEIASALPSLIASLGTLSLTFHIGYRLAGRDLALWGSLTYALAPLDLVYSTRILSDVIVTFWTAFAISAAVEAARGHHSSAGRRTLYAVGGIGLYLAYATRVSGLLGLPLLLAGAAPAFRDIRTRFEPWIAAVVLGGTLLVDGLGYLVKTASFWFPLRVETASSLGVFTLLPEAVFSPLPGLAVHCSYEEGVPHHFFKLFLGLVDHYEGVKLFSAYAPLGAAALVAALARRRLHILCFWLVFVFLYYQYGFRALEWDSGSRVLNYYLVAHRPRYLHLLLPALSLLLGSLIVEAKTRSRFALALLLAGLLAPSLYRAWHNHDFYRGSLEDTRQAARFLIGQESAPVYTDSWGAEQLEVFSGGRLQDVRVLKPGVSPEPLSWVVLGGSRGYDLSAESVAASLPEPFSTYHMNGKGLPPHWTRAFERRGPHHIARAADVAVFQVAGSDPDVDKDRAPGKRQEQLGRSVL